MSCRLARWRSAAGVVATGSAAFLGSHWLTSPASHVAEADAEPAQKPGARRIVTPSKAIGGDRAAKHFRVFSGAGEVATLDDVVESFDASDFVLVGEAHDDPVAHQLELYLLVRAHQREACGSADSGTPAARRVVLSLEQFERDVQGVVDEYVVHNLIREEDLLLDARPWANYPTDYRPLLEYAKSAGMPVVAANAPRRFVSLAGRKGLGALEGLGPGARALLPPLPLPDVSADYKAHFVWSRISEPQQSLGKDRAVPGPGTGAGGEALQPSGEDRASSNPTGGGSEAPAPTREAERPADATGAGACPYIGLPGDRDALLDPLVLWDATMAHAIAAAWARDPGCLVVHVCGSFHSEYSLGIVEMLRHYARGPGPAGKPRVTVVTIYPEEDIASFDPVRHRNAGDWVLLTDASLPRSMDITHPV